MNIILSTCGTSFLTNRVEENLRALLTRHANVKKKEEVPAKERNSIENHIRKRQTESAGFSQEEARRDSAELNGILSYYGGRPDGRDAHYLLATDTWFGEATAEIVKAWLATNGISNCQVIRHPDLQTANWREFSSSLSDLVKWCHETFGSARSTKTCPLCGSDMVCEETLRPQRSAHRRVIFNLSGGFKSETGFLQMLGMFYADETVYIFERSGELMRIPRLPVKMEDKQAIRDDLADFRRAALKLTVEAEKSGIYWFEAGGQYDLTPWGELIFVQHKTKIYEEKILPPPSDTICFGAGFLKSCEGENGERIRLINERIDQLAQFKERPNHPNPKSLHYHPIHNSSGEVPQASHEIYAWSDQDAKRIYCREIAGGTTELICLGKHL